MEVKLLNEFLADGAKQFEWFEYGKGEALTRLCDQQDFYLNKEMPIAVPVINPKGEFEEEEFWYSIVNMCWDMIHVDVVVENELLQIELNQLESKVIEVVSNLTKAHRAAAGY
jgi:hypothetical protein